MEIVAHQLYLNKYFHNKLSIIICIHNIQKVDVAYLFRLFRVAAQGFRIIPPEPVKDMDIINQYQNTTYTTNKNRARKYCRRSKYRGKT